jgi:hypothetical protein
MGQCPLSLYANVTSDLYAFRLVVEGRNYYQRPHRKAAQHTHDTQPASGYTGSAARDRAMIKITLSYNLGRPFWCKTETSQ